MSPRLGGGVGTLIFSYMRRVGLFFRIQNFEFQYFWGFQKTEYFIGYEDIFWGSSQNWIYIYRSFGCILGSFLKVKVQNGGQGTEWRIVFGLLKFQILIWGA